MKLRLALAVAFSLALVVILWVAIGGGPGAWEQEAIDSAKALRPDAAPLESAKLPERSAAAPDAVRETVTERSPAEASSGSSLLARWEGQLAGIVGRIVDSRRRSSTAAASGSPASGLDVAGRR
jgi:hypothetical protein